ncbi:MAG: glycosyltransferase [Candidatus Cloacimonas sp.]
MNILFYILCFFIATGFLTYGTFCIRFYFGHKKYKPVFNFQKRTVSVVITARNEAENLRELLLRLLNQDYPNELFEVILADDDSEDDTEQVANHFIESGLNLRYLKIIGRENAISPKKKAMQEAVDTANGELIITTDADCIVPITWISSMVSLFTDDVSMVAGYSRTYLPDWKKASFVQKYEHLDFALTYMVLGGGYTINKSWACIGQNLAYRKSAFYDVGGFSKIKHLLSGDDVNLLQLMRNKGHKIIFNFQPNSYVYTRPVKSWKQLLNQRSRWASNMKYQLKFNPEFFFILFSLACLYWGCILMLFFSWKIALMVFLFRILIECITISYSRSRFEITNDMLKFYPVWLLIQNFFLVFTMLMGQFNIFVWHGKKPYIRNHNANHNL